MKKILFIPTYTYLSSPIFTHLLPELKEFETLYLDVEDQYHCEKTSVEFKDQFNKSIKLPLKVNSETFIARVVKFFKIHRYIKRLKKIIVQESPTAIITTSDLSISIRVIKTYFPTIPVFVIQAGVSSNKGISRKYLQKIIYLFFNKILKIPLASRQNYFGNEYEDTFLLLWGEYFKKMIRNNRNIHIIGDISFDDFPIKKNIEEKKNLLSKYGYKETTNIIVICTTVKNIAEKRVVDNMYEIYKKLIVKRKDLFFIIKPHPRNNTQELRDTFESLQVENCVVLNTDLHELFRYTDIHISSFSGTALEAIASNIPIVSVNPDNQIRLQDFLNNELKEKVTSSQEMYDKIDDIIKNRDNYLALGAQYIKDKLYKIDGKSAQRAAKIIKGKLL
jgi:hypothetical protein